MGRCCSAIARSTNEACRRWRIPGSRYCIYHVERGPILIAGIIGAVLSLIVAETYHKMVPSAESRQLTAAREETAAFRKQIDHLRARIDEEQKGSVDREKLHLAQVTELNARLDPFIRSAKAKYPNMDVDQALEHLRGEMRDLKEKTAPRAFDEAQRAALVRALSADNGHQVTVASFLFDAESVSYGDLLTGVLIEAPWEVKHVKSSLYDFRGISVSNVTKYQKPLPGYFTLISALRAAGANLKSIPDRPNALNANIAEGTLLILVGRK